MSRVTFPDSFAARVERMRRAAGGDDIQGLMPDLEKLAWEDNRDGLLAGLDKDGHELAPLAASTIKHRRSETGVADPTAPPLIPARRRSRAIANYRVTSFRKSKGTWVILGAWMNVLSKRGIPFLGFHADGSRKKRRLPVRDIFGVRPAGRAKITRALRDWLMGRLNQP